ncbi:hypothetical protein MVES1_001381 [Malassezia vespertilionis]|uniref:UDP-glucose 4-epimerase n=1 Tax=Malassezia vespertilionis TaxID=2020962 RepID=A0A2N1JFG6_9BASI|nr:uncharacterized protein MVES1_001381 [Malassezia vespertilionis]PKI85280.1 Gal10p [Malassezia vespertilionis]WFD06043.1 hypothetical protein MVES1_001381 [Malassezia vespertilionis]
MEKKRVLIPGGAGYIGSHVVYTVLKTGKYNVAVVDNFHNSKPEAVRRVEQLVRDESGDACGDVELIEADLRDAAAINKVFADRPANDRIYAVILIGALKAVGESAEIPIEYYDVNVGGLLNLLTAMDKHDAKRLVYSSSATVYGAPETIPIPETTPMDPHSPYGRSKQINEMIIRDVCAAHPAWRAITLRYFNPAGAHPSGYIGEDPCGKPGNLLPLLAQMAVGKYREPGLKVFGNDYPTPDGTCVRDYIHILDLASGHLNAMVALDDDAKFVNAKNDGKYRAFNLGKGVGMSVLNMIDAMRKATGYEFPYEIVGRRPGDVPNLTADPALAEQELGFKAHHSLDEMCRDLWNWQSKNPNGYS